MKTPAFFFIKYFIQKALKSTNFLISNVMN